MTKYGKLIAQVVLASRDHPTADEIYQRLRENGTHISLATVYNNLKTLVDQGALKKIVLEGSPDRFDKPTVHQHLICARCGELSDIELPDLTGELEQRLGRPVLSYDLRISCLCDACRKAETQDKNEQA